MTDQAGKCTWIIGASSGIGEALAHILAERGDTVALSARQAPKLEAVRQSLMGFGHRVLPLDVAKPEALIEAAQSLKASWGRIDRVIFLAAIYEPQALGALDLAHVAKSIEMNLGGAFYTTEAALKVMLDQGFGEIALCASLSGYRGLPLSQPYAATKAGIINLAESLRAEHGHRLNIRLINPGFVATPMTAKNSFDMPFIISPQKAALVIAKALGRPQFEIYFPKRFSLIMKALRALPYGIYFQMIRKQVLRR